MITERPGTQAGRTSRTAVTTVGKAVWQNRPHEGLRDPLSPGKALTPNERYAALVTVARYLPVPLSPGDYLELLPAEWRVINSYGVKIGLRTYDSGELNPYRRGHSGVEAKGGRWEVRYVL